MKIVITLVIFNFVFLTVVVAQVFKIENGLSFSSMTSQKFELLNQRITSYSIFAGYDYWEHKNYYLSSEMGYVRKGGKEYFSRNTETPEVELSDYWDYLQLNTTLRLKYPYRNSHVFIGLGPKLDFLVSSKDFKDEIFSNVGYQMHSVSYGAKIEAGFVKDLKKVRIGLNGSYFLNINGMGKSEYNKLNNNTFLIMFSAGYKIK